MGVAMTMCVMVMAISRWMGLTMARGTDDHGSLASTVTCVIKIDE